jgi:hypothetical protein
MENEAAINAFAAGWSGDDAVIGVTRGTIENLTRDELQGVIAHEFSHIHNGDMRLNIRLIGLLHGILVIGLTGYAILRSIRYMGSSRSSSRRGGKDGGGGIIIAILALGAALVAIGFIGNFFGKLIKAAVSRQREFLADASAVQFTRNPDGIGGALQKIGAHSGHARLIAPKAEEASHMFFGAAVTFMLGMMSTHPPLDERIRRVLPNWDGTYPEVKKIADPAAERVEQLRSRPGPPFGLGHLPEIIAAPILEELQGAKPAAVIGTNAMAQIGAPSEQHLAFARLMLEAIPDDIESEVRNPFGARAVVACLLLGREANVRAMQLHMIASRADKAEFALVRSMHERIGAIDVRARLTLLELCMPALRAMARQQYETFRAGIDALIQADQRISVFEWTLRRVVVHHLDRQFGLVRRPTTQYDAMTRLGNEITTLLSFLALAGHQSADAALAAFEWGAAAIGNAAGQLAMLPWESISMPALDTALDRLALLAPNHKRAVLHACARCVAKDREVTVNEAELLRAIADSLDVPVPPLLPGQRLEVAPVA